jgi:hypothetical protein
VAFRKIGGGKVGKPLLFYVIDERTSDIEFYKKRGFREHKIEEKKCYCTDTSIETQSFRHAVQYSLKGFVYEVLDESQCYSGYMVTLMRLPKLSYQELLSTSLCSRKYEERFGAIGIILKEHADEFQKYLLGIEGGSKILPQKRKIVRMLRMINQIKKSTSYVRSAERILLLCEMLELDLL